VLAWAFAGPVFGFSEGWQLVINTGTTILTFLMVFLLQHSQNRDTEAVQLKLDELIRAVDGARNSLMAVERLDEADLTHLQKAFDELAERSRRREPPPETTTVTAGGTAAGEPR
jgi:low affinity Fe/Cu permease